MIMVAGGASPAGAVGSVQIILPQVATKALAPLGNDSSSGFSNPTIYWDSGTLGTWGMTFPFTYPGR